ncbi:phage tail family protein [Bacillus cereus]|uniref:phage tail domain-containing protein n=1 Tax=Bacillus cereus TaxID=1396 RepID=UPI002452E6D7|nr:phage tail domain-containing protein [Bacillus cereus]MDH4419935.1 phage tail family protein [Bacillus cereus]
MFKIYDKNMKLINLPQGIIPTKFSRSSIEKNINTSTFENVAGVINQGYNYADCDMQLEFFIRAYDLIDAELIRDELYALLERSAFFYVVSDRQGGKRHRVQVIGKYMPEEKEEMGIIYEVFVRVGSYELPFAESIGTSANIQRDGINAESNLWGFGMGLIADDESLIYQHNAGVGKKFRIFNPGNVPVHPFQQDLKMTISNVKGSVEKFQITNLTNLSKARINVPLSSTDVVIYDGPNVTRNGLEFLRNTRKDFIELSPGWNTLEIFYSESAIIYLDFRFYYK